MQSRNRFIFASRGREEKQEGVELCARHLCIRPRAEVFVPFRSPFATEPVFRLYVSGRVGIVVAPPRRNGVLPYSRGRHLLAGWPLSHLQSRQWGHEAFPLRFHRRGGLEPLEPHVWRGTLGKTSRGSPPGRLFKNTFNNRIFSGNATSKVTFPVGVYAGMGS